jgi:hypothetical protein
MPGMTKSGVNDMQFPKKAIISFIIMRFGSQKFINMDHN